MILFVFFLWYMMFDSKILKNFSLSVPEEVADAATQWSVYMSQGGFAP